MEYEKFCVELEMKFSESEDCDSKDPANCMEELGTYLTGHWDADEGFHAGE